MLHMFTPIFTPNCVILHSNMYGLQLNIISLLVCTLLTKLKSNHYSVWPISLVVSYGYYNISRCNASRRFTLGLLIYNNLTLPSGYALTPAHDPSSYTSHLMWYTPFWSPLGIFRKVQIRTKLQTSHHLSTISGYLHIAKDLLVVWDY